MLYTSLSFFLQFFFFANLKADCFPFSLHVYPFFLHLPTSALWFTPCLLASVAYILSFAQRYTSSTSYRREKCICILCMCVCTRRPSTQALMHGVYIHVENTCCFTLAKKTKQKKNTSSPPIMCVCVCVCVIGEKRKGNIFFFFQFFSPLGFPCFPTCLTSLSVSSCSTSPFLPPSHGLLSRFFRLPH